MWGLCISIFQALLFYRSLIHIRCPQQWGHTAGHSSVWTSSDCHVCRRRRRRRRTVRRGAWSYLSVSWQVVVGTLVRWRQWRLSGEFSQFPTLNINRWSTKNYTECKRLRFSRQYSVSVDTQNVVKREQTNFLIKTRNWKQTIRTEQCSYVSKE